MDPDAQEDDQRKALIDAYQAAMNAERELWEQLKSMKSGSPAYEALWKLWMQAARRTATAANELREAFSGQTRPGDLS